MTHLGMVISDYDSYEVDALEKSWTHEAFLNVFNLLNHPFCKIFTDSTLFVLNPETNNSKSSAKHLKQVSIIQNHLFK